MVYFFQNYYACEAETEVQLKVRSWYISGYLSIILRNILTSLVTFYFCVKVSQKEAHRLRILADNALPNHHLVDIELVFDSVMPRDYFIQFLN